MRTLADIKRRATPGTRLKVVKQTKRPVLAGTIRTIVARHSDRCYDFTSSNTGDQVHCVIWPAAGTVRILDADTFEYDLPGREKHIIRLRFLLEEDR